MKNWKQIITFTYPHEAHIVKGKLEAEGISVQIRDELTAQVNNLYSNAIGGVKLFVDEDDFEKAYQILIDAKYINATEQTKNKALKRFDKFSRKIPFIGKLIFEIRLIIFIVLLISFSVISIFVLTRPTKLERLTKDSWCVEKIYYLGKELKPYSTGIKLTSEYDNCSEIMNFRENGIVTFPGINSIGDRCKWKLENDKLIILNRDTTKSIFVGKYNLDIDDNQIRMQSENITIIGKKYIFDFNF